MTQHRTRAGGAIADFDDRWYPGAFDHWPHLLCIAGFDGYFRRLNPAWERTLGFKREELLPRPFVDLVHPDDHDRILVEVQRLAGGGVTRSFEHRCRTKDGSYRWIDWTATPLVDEDVFYAIGHDVTERRQTSRELELLYAITRALSGARVLKRSAPILIEILCTSLGWTGGELWVVDRRREALECRGRWFDDPAAFSRFVGTSRDCLLRKGEDLPGRAWARKRPAWIADLAAEPEFPRQDVAIAEGLVSACVVPLTLAGETRGVVQLFSTRHQPPDADVLRLLLSIAGQIGQFIDRLWMEESLRLSEEQYRHAQKMEAIGLLAGGVAHDFNNLLTIILGFADCALSSLTPDAPLSEALREIRKAGERAAELTQQLLAFSRRQVLQPILVDLNEMVADTERMLRRLIGEDIELCSHLAAGLGNVKADSSQLQQILMNLAVNARDAMTGGGRLIIETANVELDADFCRPLTDVEPGPYVLLAVSDTGCGMDEATRSRAFEPFFTTKERGQGTGMGLATIYGIVKQSRGHIALYSEPGYGTTFRIYLPRTFATALAPPAAPAPRLERGTESILLVEDEESVRGLTKFFLQSSGYTVVDAPCGNDALEALEKRARGVDLLLTDVVMPGMSGRELADHVRERHPGTRVLYTSGYTDQAIARRSVLEEGHVLLQKPFTRRGLLTKVRQVLDERS
ncbi:MAG: response regulator [Planctomycetes bacterium]|nr:response regulator [Planctomycetota bacterium]